MRVLITGGGGQLATDIHACALGRGHAPLAVPKAALDIADGLAIREAFSSARPDVVVNCAAWTAVDYCEQDAARAELVNGAAVGMIAESAMAVGAHLVQISTDYVFDGHKALPYVEGDEPNPQSAYGKSKLIGEQLAGANASVVRTSWLYSRHGGNMVETICRLASEHDVLSFVSDQVGNPTSTADLAGALLNISEQRAAGIWHCTNAGSVSWFEFAQAVLLAAGEEPGRVKPIRTVDLLPRRPAHRPPNSVLANERYNSLFASLPDFRDELEGVVSAYVR